MAKDRQKYGGVLDKKRNIGCLRENFQIDIPGTNYIEADYQGRGKLLGVPNEYWKTVH